MAFGATEEVPYDTSGRIVLPPMMRRKGEIEDLALFLGVGETFQIWNPKLLLDDQRIPEDMKDIARFRLEEKGLQVMTGRGCPPQRPHVPVLLDEVIAALAIQPGRDACRRHLRSRRLYAAMLEAGAGRVIAFDRDPEAIEAGRRSSRTPA